MDVDQQIATWMDKYVDRLTHLAFTYVGDWAKAEDVVQEAFFKAYQSIHQLKSPSSALPWLMQIVINECRTLYRKTWREIVTSLLPDHGTVSAENVYFDRLENQSIYSAVMGLPEIYRTPIYLYYLEDLSTKEIADVLGVNPGTIRVRLARGRKHLQRHLKRGDEDERGGTNSKVGGTVPITYRR